MRIQHNITAMNSLRNFTTNNSSLAKNLEKLSSGYKINRAGDDAAGLAISEKMRAQITGLEGATKNAKDGISLIQTAEGALTEVHSMLNRMVTLTEQSANGTYDNDVDRAQLQKEVDALKTEIDRVADSTNFNGLKLLDGSLSGTKPDQESTVTGNIEGMSLDATKAKQQIEFQDFDTDALDSIDDLDNTSITLNIGLSDGTSKSINLNFKTNNNELEIQDDNGKVLNTFTPATGGAIDASGATGADALKDTVIDSFRKAVKNDEDLGKLFTASVVDTDGSASTRGDSALVLETKQAGSDAVTVSTVDITAANKGNKAYDNDGQVGTMFKASNGLNSTTGKLLAADDTAITAQTTVEGKDAVTAFKAEDITLYNDNYVDAKDGHKGNADKAVFEVNGQKFAIGTSNQTRTNLDADVHFISIKSLAAAPTGTAASGNDGVALKEMPGDTGKGGKQSNLTEAPNAAGFTRYLDNNALKQIADEISKVTGVQVDYNNKDYKIKDKDNGVPGATFDGGEQLSGKNAAGTADLAAGKAVPVFTIGKQIGKEGKSLTLQIGDTSDDFNKMSVQVADMHVEALGLKDIDISTQEGASEALTKIKNAVNLVSDTRGGLGALQNRLDHTINNLGVMRENIQNAESLIRDTDVAEEMMTYTKNNILNQSAQSMLAQANQLPQGVLQLLG